MTGLKRVKKVLLLYVGGTVGMEKNENGALVTKPDVLLKKLKSSHLHDDKLTVSNGLKLKNNELISSDVSNTIVTEIIEYETLLDSSNMSPTEWTRIAKDIECRYEDYDGFVILHGTDTLCYTSSVLSFMFEGLKKPVILTGSQVPICEPRTDAFDNILSSIVLAGCHYIPEVCVYFANKLFRGNRTTKRSSSQLDAFTSPMYHLLAERGIHLKIYDNYIRSAPHAKFSVNTRLNPNVGVICFYPTITAAMVKFFLKPPIEGAVFQTYGVGNVPSLTNEIMETIKEAIENGVIILNISQCMYGTVSSIYESGKMLEQIGVIFGRDMTTEAALAKLYYVLGLPDLTLAERKKLMETDLRGECSSF